MIVVTERNFDDVVTPKMRHEFWARVEWALRELYRADTGKLDRYRQSLDEAETFARMLAFHDEPIQIAADLAGKALTERDHRAYRDQFPAPVQADQPLSTLP